MVDDLMRAIAELEARRREHATVAIAVLTERELGAKAEKKKGKSR
jgi:hypothetical protein